MLSSFVLDELIGKTEVYKVNWDLPGGVLIVNHDILWLQIIEGPVWFMYKFENWQELNRHF